MFYAVGVGPGDPMWMTREACAVLEACPVIAAPQTASGEMLALSIAQGAAELGGKTVLPLSFAMSRDAAVRAAGYAHAADAIAPELDAGRDVAMVNLGDVSIYATAYYVLDELRRRFDYRYQQKPAAGGSQAGARFGGGSSAGVKSEAQRPVVVQPTRSTAGMRSVGVRQGESSLVEGAAPASCGDYAVGDRVSHLKFGAGVIRRIETLDRKSVV